MFQHNTPATTRLHPLDQAALHHVIGGLGILPTSATMGFIRPLMNTMSAAADLAGAQTPEDWEALDQEKKDSAMQEKLDKLNEAEDKIEVAQADRNQVTVFDDLMRGFEDLGKTLLEQYLTAASGTGSATSTNTAGAAGKHTS
jgi:hypothetical protein